VNTAHLCVRLQVAKGIPRVVSVGIFSSGPQGLTCMGGELFAELMRVEAESYGAAHDRLMHICRTVSWYQWTLPWMEGP
jgi:hypothetical protein